MKLFTINQKNIVKRNANIKQHKNELLYSLIDIKQKYPESKQLFNEIAINIQHKVNNNDLKEEDIIDLAKKMEHKDIYCIDAYETINSLIFLSMHQNSLFKTKHAWFGETNKTRSVGMFIEGKINSYIPETKPFFKDLLDSTVKGYIKLSVGIAYTNSHIIHSSVLDFTHAKLCLDESNEPMHDFYEQLIYNTDNIAKAMDNTHNFEVIKFTQYLYRMLQII